MVVKASEDPSEEVTEDDHAKDGSGAYGDKDGKGLGLEGLELRDGLDHDELIVPEEEEDEAAGDPGNDHAGHRDDATEEEVNDIVVLGGGLQKSDADGDGSPYEKGKDSSERPGFDLFPHEIDGRDDEPEEKGPDVDGMVREEVFQDLGKGENADDHPEPQRGEEGEIDLRGEITETTGEEEFERSSVEIFQRIDEPLVDAGDEGDSAARDAGNDVGGTHRGALEEDGK